MAWANASVTNAGNQMLLRYIEGEQFYLDYASGGVGTADPSALIEQTALADQKQQFTIIGVEDVENGKKIDVHVTNTGLEAGYQMQQLGIWAHVEDGEPALFAILQDDGGIAIASEEDIPEFSLDFFAVILISNTAQFNISIDPTTLVSYGIMDSAITAAVDTLMQNISLPGLLKGDGQGNIIQATPGEDFAYPTAAATTDPTPDTPGSVGQRYLNTATGKEFVCTGIEGGEYVWQSSGASSAEDISVGGQPLSTVLGNMQGDITEAKTQSGTTDPTSSTAGAIGQQYLNTETEEMFVCVAITGGMYAWSKSGGSGPSLSPQFLVMVSDGASITATDGTNTITGTSENGEATLVLPGFGTYTVSASLSGQTSNTETVVVDTVKQYVVALSFFTAALTVTAEAGATVTATSGPSVYTGTAAANGKCSLTVNTAGTYSVKAALGGVNSSTASVSVTSSGSTYTAAVAFCTLTVTIDSGSAVTATNGGTTLNGTSTGTVKFYLPNTGTWTVSASKSGETTSGSVNASAYQGYSLSLSYVKITGVEWNYAGSSTALTRLTKTSDPNSVVTVNISTEPNPAVGTGSGSSPFDSLMPWSGIDEFNIVSNAVSYQKGNANFNRTNNDTVVRIPKFYYKVEKDTANSKMRFYIADKAKNGFSVHPAFARGDGAGERNYIYVGKYNTGANYVTKSGLAPLASMTRAAARTGSHNKGTKWWQYDYAAWSAIWLLYLVEFADWNSQAQIGKGHTDGSNSAAINTGGCDSMTYHTGRAAGTDGKTAVMYRWMENLWGNVRDWVDGANFNNRLAYLCLNPANFADDTATNYTSTGVTLASSGWIKELGLSSAFPFAFLPTVNGGSETTYVPDYLGSSAGWCCLDVGGGWDGAGSAGLFCFDASYSSTNAGAALGARLLFLP